MTRHRRSPPGLPFRHGFFTRRGGVSEGPFASLNCSLSGRRSRARRCWRTARAWRRPRRRSGRPRQPLPGARRRRRARRRSPGRRRRPARRRDGDRPRRASPSASSPPTARRCCSRTPAAGVVGAAHAGWRGALAGVLEATLAAMAALGADAGRIAAAIGPCIAQGSYEVGRRSARRGAGARRRRDARFFARRRARRALAVRSRRLLRRAPARGRRRPRSSVLGVDTLRRARTVSSAIAAARWPAAGRSATRSRSLRCRMPRFGMAHIMSRIASSLALAVLLAAGRMRRPIRGRSRATPARPRCGSRSRRPPGSPSPLPSARCCRTPPAPPMPTPRQGAAGRRGPGRRRAPAKGDWRLVVTAELRGDSRSCRIFTVDDPAGSRKGTTEGPARAPPRGRPREPATLTPGRRRRRPRHRLPADQHRSARGSRATRPASLNRPPRVAFNGVTGAPGDGNTALARADARPTRQARRGRAGQPDRRRLHARRRRHRRRRPRANRSGWKSSGRHRRQGPRPRQGRAAQRNPRAARSTGYWGDVAVVVAQEAAGGVQEVILKQQRAIALLPQRRMEPAPGRPSPGMPLTVHGQRPGAVARRRRAPARHLERARMKIVACNSNRPLAEAVAASPEPAAHPRLGAPLRRHGGVRRDPREHPRRGCVRGAIHLVSGQRQPDGAADHARCAAPRLGAADHGGDPVFRLRPAGPQIAARARRSAPSWSPT